MFCLEEKEQSFQSDHNSQKFEMGGLVQLAGVERVCGEDGHEISPAGG